MRGWPQAVTVITFTALAVTISPLLIPLLWVSAAAVGLVGLRLGVVRGLQVIAASTALLAVLLVLALSQSAWGVVTWVVWWSLALVVATVLRVKVSLAAAVEAIGILVGLGLVAFHIAVGDPAAWWSAQFAAMFGDDVQGPVADLRQMMMASAGIMTQATAISLLASQVLGLLLARHWQAVLYNPGGFRGEFHSLRFDMRWSLLVVVLVVASWFTRQPMLADLAGLSVLIYALQGLAVLHALGGARKLPRYWMILIYAPMVLLFTAAVQLLALLGLVDTWLDLRKRMGAEAG
ncbi:MAG: hypothetical protein H6981_04080 [Gammaproteobacteria bacterium]|nr:hypothetical protein [Gammaproteobacteria bacterium]MCP5135960.1 hypothetical protein [Gammaproteobacteria bacterium]